MTSNCFGIKIDELAGRDLHLPLGGPIIVQVYSKSDHIKPLRATAKFRITLHSVLCGIKHPGQLPEADAKPT